MEAEGSISRSVELFVRYVSAPLYAQYPKRRGLSVVETQLLTLTLIEPVYLSLHDFIFEAFYSALH